MIRKYTFFDGGTVEFEDSGTVRALIAHAFEEFGYYEPLGMETVTVFQSHHSAGSTGWFTKDVDRTCAEEIENPEDLYFACHIPGVLFYAEGGWGHHMAALGNCPELPCPVSLRFRQEDFDHTLVMNGNLPLGQILEMLRQAEYLPEDGKGLTVRAVNPWQPPYEIGLEDPVLALPLGEFEKTLPDAVTILTVEAGSEKGRTI